MRARDEITIDIGNAGSLWECGLARQANYAIGVYLRAGDWAAALAQAQAARAAYEQGEPWAYGTWAQIGIGMSIATQRLAAVEPMKVKAGPPTIDPEVVRLTITPASALRSVRDMLRDAIATIRGPGHLLETADWTPHISVAYSNSDGPMEPFLKALDRPPAPVTVTINEVQLIILSRDSHLYEWQTRAVIPLKG